VSTIKVDTYLTRGGASEIAIDKLKGVSSAASISVVGEGGSTTTNLQQGLAKMWALGNEGSGSLDSFNNSGTTDNGTGDYTKAFTNSFSSNNIACVGTSAGDNTRNYIDTQTRATGSIQIRAQDQSASAQDSRIAMGIWGDLA
jgi:hypothetical protein